MLIQIAIGSAVILSSILFAALLFSVLEPLGLAYEDWLRRPPHRPKLIVAFAAALIGILATMTANVWAWALVFLWIGVFSAMEPALYFALVCFTTLGFGDVILPVEWRILSGFAAANGFLSFGLVTAAMMTVLRRLRLAQLRARRGRRDAEGDQPIKPA